MRLAGKLKLGYYPCPDRVVDMVLSHIIKPTGRVSWIDPCAGEGRAISRVCAAMPNALMYGIELSKERAEACRALPFTQFGQGDAVVEFKFARKSYSAVWFNPPYDFDKDFKREELRWYLRLIYNRQAAKKKTDEVYYTSELILKHEGLFVGILPVRALEVLAPHLLNALDGADGKGYPEVYLFPDPEYDQFEQCVVFGQRRSRIRGIVDPDDLHEWIETATSDDCPVLDYATTPKWKLPTHIGDEQPQEFMKIVFDPEEGQRLATAVGWNTRDDMRQALWPEEIKLVEALLELKPAHLAAAIAAGFFNGEVIKDEIVKGVTRKVWKTTVDNEKQPDGSKMTVKTETFESELQAFNRDGQFAIYRLKKGQADDKSDE